MTKLLIDIEAKGDTCGMCRRGWFFGHNCLIFGGKNIADDKRPEACLDAQQAAEKLEAELKQAKESKWIPTSDKYPESGTKCLATRKGGTVHVYNFFCLECDCDEVIAWMPLPEPYKLLTEEA